MIFLAFQLLLVSFFVKKTDLGYIVVMSNWDSKMPES